MVERREPNANRDDVLRAVRAATARRILPHTHGMEPVADEVGRMTEDAPLADTFTDRAEAAGMNVRRVADIESARVAVVEIVRSEGHERVTTWDTPLFDELDLPAALSRLGVGVERWNARLSHDERKGRAFATTCGITGVQYGIAETGSLVVCSSPRTGRSVSLLGRTHIALVKVEQLIADLYDLPPRLAADYPDGIPSNVTLITGPSKTADIELQLVIGVHGPGTVHVVLVKP